MDVCISVIERRRALPDADPLRGVPGVVAPEGWPRLPMLWGAPLRRHANPNDDSQHRTLSRAPWILSNHLGHARLMSVIGTCVMMPALPHCL